MAILSLYLFTEPGIIMIRHIRYIITNSFDEFREFFCGWKTYAMSILYVSIDTLYIHWQINTASNSKQNLGWDILNIGVKIYLIHYIGENKGDWKLEYNFY